MNQPWYERFRSAGTLPRMPKDKPPIPTRTEKVKAKSGRLMEVLRVIHPPIKIGKTGNVSNARQTARYKRQIEQGMLKV